MSKKEESGALPAKVSSSFKRLKTSASALNAASDRFVKLVGEIEAQLKPLNIGISCWVKITGSDWSCEDGPSSGHDLVGYTKLNGKWCIALGSVEKELNGFTGQDETQTQYWAFADAPRRLRLEAIDQLPNLLNALAEQTDSETKNIAKKTELVEHLVSALRDGGAE